MTLRHRARRLGAATATVAVLATSLAGAATAAAAPTPAPVPQSTVIDVLDFGHVAGETYFTIDTDGDGVGDRDAQTDLSPEVVETADLGATKYTVNKATGTLRVKIPVYDLKRLDGRTSRCGMWSRWSACTAQKFTVKLQAPVQHAKSRYGEYSYQDTATLTYNLWTGNTPKLRVDRSKFGYDKPSHAVKECTDCTAAAVPNKDYVVIEVPVEHLAMYSGEPHMRAVYTHVETAVVWKWASPSGLEFEEYATDKGYYGGLNEDGPLLNLVVPTPKS